MDIKAMSAYNPYTAASQNTGGQNAAPSSNNTAVGASAAVQISEEAKQKFAEHNIFLQTLDEATLLKISEKIAGRKGKDLMEVTPKESLDPYLTYLYPENSLGSMLTEKLDGKVANSSYAAKQFTDLFYTNNADATTEERAANRATAVKLAEQIAQEYFGEEEGQAFLAEVQKFADRSAMADKGYTVFHDSDQEPLKPYNTLTNAPADYVNISANDYAKKYFGITDKKEVIARLGEILNDMGRNPGRMNQLRNEIVADFAANEAKVQKVIDQTEEKFSSISFGADFMADLTNVLAGLNQSGSAELAGNILKMFQQK
jgi:hypothetical protein